MCVSHSAQLKSILKSFEAPKQLAPGSDLLITIHRRIVEFDDADLNALCKTCSRPRSSSVSQRCRWLRSPSSKWPQQTRLAPEQKANKEWPLAPAVVSTLPPLITKSGGKNTRPRWNLHQTIIW